MSRTTDERLTELEIQLAHQMRLYDSLNEVVIEQAKQLDKQQRTIKQLISEMRALKAKGSSDDSASLEDEKPPHY